MLLNKMKWIIQALAQQPDIQIALFPSFVNVPDELALIWEEALRELDNSKIVLSNEQKNLIRCLDDYISSISGISNIDIWDIDALYHSIEWKNIRKLAKQVGIKMGWQLTPPNKNEEIYIGI